MIFSTLIIIKDFKTKLDEKFNRTKRRVDEITPSDILLLAEIVYSLYSGEINPQALLKLGKR